jgi:predicted nuclease of predicted toxin-antitoxin system
MRLLFDQNISFRIVSKLIDNFPDCKHVSQLKLHDCEDHEIWAFSKNKNYVIVTFDSDFYDISLINGCPPKIIWIRTGNITTNEIAQLFKDNRATIFDFINNPEQFDIACLELTI